jgi:hypothetical protein
MAFNLFWGAGYFIFSAVTNTGDWAFVLRDLSFEPRWLWRLLMGALGVVLYVLSTRAIGIHLPPGTPLVWPYLVAGVVSCVAALFYAGPTLPAVHEAARESFVSAGGLLYLAYHSSRQARGSPLPILVAHSNGWLLFSALVTILFFLVLGRGVVEKRVGDIADREGAGMAADDPHSALGNATPEEFAAHIEPKMAALNPRSRSGQQWTCILKNLLTEWAGNGEGVRSFIVKAWKGENV